MNKLRELAKECRLCRHECAVNRLEGERGFLIPVGDPQALAEAIADVLEKKEETARRTAAARGLVEREHDYPQMIGRYEALFSEVMGRNEG